ncbi:hypothetical protein [Stutzerimonas nitrititolerans]|uniref:hypothetical protein n=1 Tax=Stutzerimonas nitrititolerans TaxID=2482751 RepID=UPI00289AC34C|nr:hypothetical protein [Stutzerimonas nitrititolerans]
MKKVLIISNNSLSFSSNNGRTLNSFFGEFELGSVSQIFFNDDIPESVVAKNFYNITGRAQFFSFFKKNRYSAGSEVFGDYATEEKRKGKNYLGQVVFFVNNYLEAIKLFFRDFLYSSGLNKNKKILDWAKRQKPDFIFFVVGNSCFSIGFAIYLSRALSVPLFVYITDDYVIYNKPAGIFGGLYHKLLVLNYKKLFISARNIFFIGSEMKRQFGRVYGVDGDCLINCNFVSKVARPGLSASQIRLVYAGGLHLGRLKSLIDFARYMREICSEVGHSFYLDVYTNNEKDGVLLKRYQKSGVFYRGRLSWAELQVQLQKADFLLHIESFQSAYSKKTKLSLSTKIPEYLSSGTCVIAYGPEELASIKIFREETIGIAISFGDSKSKVDLIKAVADKKYREEISSRAFVYAVDNFSPQVVRSRLYDKVLEI